MFGLILFFWLDSQFALPHVFVFSYKSFPDLYPWFCMKSVYFPWSLSLSPIFWDFYLRCIFNYHIGHFHFMEVSWILLSVIFSSSFFFSYLVCHSHYSDAGPSVFTSICILTPILLVFLLNFFWAFLYILQTLCWVSHFCHLLKLQLFKLKRIYENNSIYNSLKKNQIPRCKPNKGCERPLQGKL
jgi:hypothetical protein